jgi:hypothetical protein
MDIVNISDLKNEVNLDRYIKDCSINLEFSYVSNFKSAKTLRDIVNYIWKKLELPEITISRLILIIDEMNNNAIEHWSNPWDINKFRFKSSLNSSKQLNLIIEFEDSWKKPWAKKAIDMETLRAHRLKRGYSEHSSIRWRWLFMIIFKIVDRLYFKDSENWWLIVWIKKNIKI